MDWIRIRGLSVECIVGIRSYERVRRQPVHVHLRLGANLSSAAASGDLEDTADYAFIARAVSELLHFRRYHLLEHAGAEIIALLFARFSLLEEIEVELEKPEALAGIARSASVLLTRKRQDLRPVPGPTPETMVWFHGREGRVEAQRMEGPRNYRQAAEQLCMEWCIFPGRREPETRVLVAGESSTLEIPDAGALVLRVVSLGTEFSAGPKTDDDGQ